MHQSEREIAELDKFIAETHKLNAEHRKLVIERKKLGREFMLYPYFVGAIWAASIAAFIKLIVDLY